MASDIDRGVAGVLSKNRLKLAHPGDAKLTGVYATPADVTSILAETVTYRGQLRVTSNNSSLGGQSNFIISSSSLFSNIFLHGFLKPNTSNQAWAVDGWGFGLIDSLEFTFSNSLMQSAFIRGDVYREYCLMQCSNREEMFDMLKNAGQASVKDCAGAVAGQRDEVSSVCYFSIPIVFMNFKACGLDSSFPLDGSVLAGPVTISVNWKPASQLQHLLYSTNGTTQAATMVPKASIDNLEISCQTVVLQDANFSVKKAMLAAPELIYSLPATYVTSVNYSVPNVVCSGTTHLSEKMTINLTSAPSGMLEAIILKVVPNKLNGVDWTTRLIGTDTKGSDRIIPGGGLVVNYLRLSFGGQNIIRYETPEERRQFQRAQFRQDLTYLERIAAHASSDSAKNHMFEREAELCIIPLTHDSQKVLRGHLNENLPSYGGAQMQLEFSIIANHNSLNSHGSNDAKYPQMCPATTTLNFGDPASELTTVIVSVGYVVSAILEASQGTIDLQL